MPSPDSNHPTPPSQEFHQLLANEQKFLHLLIRTLGVSSSDSHDVLQNANIYLIENSAKFTPGTNFRAWTTTVVRYRCLTYFREQKRRPMVNLSEQALDLIAEETVKQYDETEKQLQHLNHCLKLLPPENAQLVDAIYQQGQTLKDYASQHNKSHTAVRKTISRIRQILKDCIESQSN